MTSVRTPLGKVEKRELATINIIEDGSKTFHVVRFQTQFANQSVLIERIALEREDGAYRVSGYFFE